MNKRSLDDLLNDKLMEKFKEVHGREPLAMIPGGKISTREDRCDAFDVYLHVVKYVPSCCMVSREPEEIVLWVEM